jgi:hypothetical protein
MSDSSISWIGLGLSALLILDKLLTKSKKVKCKCCGSEFEASEFLSTPMSPAVARQTEAELSSVKLETIKEEHIEVEARIKKE